MHSQARLMHFKVQLLPQCRSRQKMQLGGRNCRIWQKTGAVARCLGQQQPSTAWTVRQTFLRKSLAVATLAQGGPSCLVAWHITLKDLVGKMSWKLVARCVCSRSSSLKVRILGPG